MLRLLLRQILIEPSKTFYNLTPVVPSDTRKTFGSSDTDVTGRNNITFNNTVIRNEHVIIKTDDTNFSFNLKEKTIRISKICF